MRSTGFSILLPLTGLPGPAMAQVVGVALDPKAKVVNGELKIVRSPPPDSVVFFRFSGAKARTLGRVRAPTSFQGPALECRGLATVPASNPFHSPNSMVVLLKIEGKRLRRVDAAPFGPWAQGVGFLDDSRMLFAQSLSSRSMHLFRIDGDALKVAAPAIVFKDGGPVSHGIAGR